MIIYTSDSSGSNIVRILAKQKNISILEAFYINQSTKSVCDLGWDDILKIISVDDLFQETELSPLFKICIDSLAINDIVCKKLQHASSETLIVLYSTSVVDKSVLSMLSFSGIEIAPTTKSNRSEVQTFIREYCTQNALNVSDKQSNDIQTITSDYNEISDILDILNLTGNQNSYLESLKHEDIRPLYMLSLQRKTFSRDILPFIRNLTQDTLQMTISLIYTKLEKLNTPISSSLLSEVILTDKNIKSSGILSPVLHMKLMAWKLSQLTK